MTHPTHSVNGYILYEKSDSVLSGHLHHWVTLPCNVRVRYRQHCSKSRYCCFSLLCHLVCRCCILCTLFNSEIMVVSKLSPSHLIAIFLTPCNCKQNVLSALFKTMGMRCNSVVRMFCSSCNRLSGQSFMVDPLSYFFVPASAPQLV